MQGLTNRVRDGAHNQGAHNKAVTRIIAGRFGGRRLKVPDDGTRPTSDRVREAVFSMLDARLDFDGMRVLDLYAGSGALGIEALSRGAASAVFVDNRRRATTIVSANLAAVGASGVGRVVTSPVSGFLAATAPQRFDLVFSDPPYALDGIDVAADLTALVAGGWLAEGGALVLEHARRAEITWPTGWESVVERTYGDTVVVLARPAAKENR